MLNNRPGVSIVICCHNSASRLGPTLNHLATQRVANEQIPWEVIVVDNASTDNTATLAHTLWPREAPAPLRVVNEPQKGLMHARMRGFVAAGFELVSFVDDDNWVCPRWVATVAELMSQHPDAGACGGQSTAVCELTPPLWFAQHATKYAVGQQAMNSGDVTDTRGYLWGAGLTIRQSAWQQLLEAQFQPVLPGRSGTLLTTGEDCEICFALRLAGWRLWYDERLTLRHYLPAQRLEWRYLRRLTRANGAAFVVFDLYPVSLYEGENPMARVQPEWPASTMRCAKELFTCLMKSIRSLSNQQKRRQYHLQIEFYQGKLRELFRQRRNYRRMVAKVQNLSVKLERLNQRHSETLL